MSKLVKSIYNGNNVTALGELTPTDIIDGPISINGDLTVTGTITGSNTGGGGGSGGGVPAGVMVIAKIGSTLEGFLPLDGNIVDVTTYPNLIPFLLSTTTIAGGNLTAPVSMSASSSFEANLPSNLIDGNTGTGWFVEGANGSWVMADMGTEVTINGYNLSGNPNYGWPYLNWVLQGSNDGNTFATISTEANGAVYSGGVNVPFAVQTPGSYRYYRFLCNSSGGYTGLSEIQLFSGATVEVTYRTRVSNDVLSHNVMMGPPIFNEDFMLYIKA